MFMTSVYHVILLSYDLYNMGLNKISILDIKI